MFLIDMEMVQEFVYFCEAIYEENPNSVSRLAYYEMMLWIRVNNEDKITELCNYIATNDDGDKPNFKESHLLALCESDRKKELLLLLQIIDIIKISLGHLPNIFKSLGRLLLESFVKKFILELKSYGVDIEAGNTSNFIYNYAISMPNLAVHMALDIVDQMFEAGLTLSIETFHSILHACEESCDYNLIYQQPTPLLFPLLYPYGCTISVQNMSKEEFLKIQMSQCPVLEEGVYVDMTKIRSEINEKNLCYMINSTFCRTITCAMRSAAYRIRRGFALELCT